MEPGRNCCFHSRGKHFQGQPPTCIAVAASLSLPMGERRLLWECGSQAPPRWISLLRLGGNQVATECDP